MRRGSSCFERSKKDCLVPLVVGGFDTVGTSKVGQGSLRTKLRLLTELDRTDHNPDTATAIAVNANPTTMIRLNLEELAFD